MYARFCSEIRPYLKLMRLHQPVGTWLLLWPCWWSVGLAADHLFTFDNLSLLLRFLLGAVIMRSAACIINDIWDRHIDAQVERTKNRPLARGTLNIWQALVLLSILLLSGLVILLSLNHFTVMLGIVFLIMLTIYPLTKRFMQIPQIFLGFTINAGALMGWGAVHGELSLIPWLLYMACFFWTLGYDTIYAHQDKLCDQQIGIHSAALTLGTATKLHINIYYAMMSALLFCIGLLTQQGWPYYLGLTVFFLLLFRQLICINLDNTTDCLNRFRAHARYGMIIFIGISGVWLI